SMRAQDESAVRDTASHADAIVVCAAPFGPANLGNLRAVARSASRTVLLGTLAAEEDFAHGEALRLWSALQRGGALQCDDVRSITACVEEVASR
ncbi:MAG: hypothetical protein Q7W16_09555, partial [Coriobacteriia bacterium]|nr:hypothetical protein [Coriobacteriia bacterium]